MESETTTIALTDLEKSAQLAKNANKTAFFWDTTGNCATFYSYTGKLVECAQMQVQKAMAGTSVDDIKEKYRIANKFAMFDGSTVVFNFSRIVPDLKGEYFDDTTTPSCIFIPSEMAVEATYKKTLKEGEDKDAMGNEGGFYQHKDYTVVVVSEASPDDEEYMA